MVWRFTPAFVIQACSITPVRPMGSPEKKPKNIMKAMRGLRYTLI
jgi:hypothetical protein